VGTGKGRRSGVPSAPSAELVNVNSLEGLV
jgi:hypothetical protein